LNGYRGRSFRLPDRCAKPTRGGPFLCGGGCDFAADEGSKVANAETVAALRNLPALDRRIAPQGLLGERTAKDEGRSP
jgi:hypothetical protein